MVDTNVILRAADRQHPASQHARVAMKLLFRRGDRLCLARQTLVEAWVVMTRPRQVNGFGYPGDVAASAIAKLQKLFRVLPDLDEIYLNWEQLVIGHQVLGKKAHDARLVGAMRVYGIGGMLTFNGSDFQRYGVQVVDPAQVK